MKTGPFKGNKSEGTFSGAELYEAVKAQEDSQGREVLLNNLQYFDEPYLISLSGYNRILKLKGAAPSEKPSGCSLYQQGIFKWGYRQDNEVCAENTARCGNEPRKI